MHEVNVVFEMDREYFCRFCLIVEVNAEMSSPISYGYETDVHDGE